VAPSSTDLIGCGGAWPTVGQEESDTAELVLDSVVVSEATGDGSDEIMRMLVGRDLGL
jgi:hypothetical protein